MFHPWFDPVTEWTFEAPHIDEWKFDETDVHNFHGMLLVAGLVENAREYVFDTLMSKFVHHMDKEMAPPSNLGVEYTQAEPNPPSIRVWQRIFNKHASELMAQLMLDFNLPAFDIAILETEDIDVLVSLLGWKKISINTQRPVDVAVGKLFALKDKIRHGFPDIEEYLKYPWPTTKPKVAFNGSSAGPNRALYDKIAEQVHLTYRFLKAAGGYVQYKYMDKTELCWTGRSHDSNNFYIQPKGKSQVQIFCLAAACRSSPKTMDLDDGLGVPQDGDATLPQKRKAKPTKSKQTKKLHK